MLGEMLPEEIIRNVIEPYYDVSDLAYQYVINNELNLPVWEQIFKHHYPEVYKHGMDPAAVRRSFFLTPYEDLFLITVMLGYFDTFPPEELMSDKEYTEDISDLMMWVFLKRNQNRINLAQFFQTYWEQLVSWFKVGTILFLIQQVGLVFNLFRFVELLINTQYEIDPNLDPEDFGEMTVVYAEKLMRYVVDYGLTENYRLLDHRFIPSETRTETSVFGYLMLNMPTVAAYYIDVFEADEVLDYLLIVGGESYLHIAVRRGVVSLYDKLLTKKPILLRMRDIQGRYAHDLVFNDHPPHLHD